MIYEDKFGNFLGEDEFHILKPSKVLELDIHMLSIEEMMEAIRY